MKRFFRWIQIRHSKTIFRSVVCTFGVYLLFHFEDHFLETDFSDRFISQLSVMYGLRSKIRDQRDKRDSRDLRDPAKNPGRGPGRKIRKSGIRDRDRDSKLKNPGTGTGTGTQIRGTRDSGTQLGGTVPGT